MKALRVLVVEDDALIGMLLAETLEGMGYEVCAVAASEADAVADAGRCEPDLMIVDAQLGDGSGVAAVEKILRAGFIPHLFITGNAAGVRTLDPGAIIIDKPFFVSDLGQAIKRALASAPT